MIFEWTRVGPPVTAAFLGSLLEFIEALTIVIAVGQTTTKTRSCRNSEAGGNNPLRSHPIHEAQSRIGDTVRPRTGSSEAREAGHAHAEFPEL
jgi:hypothetical protein